MKEKLRNAVRDYFVEKNAAAIHHIESIAATIKCCGQNFLNNAK